MMTSIRRWRILLVIDAAYRVCAKDEVWVIDRLQAGAKFNGPNQM